MSTNLNFKIFIDLIKKISNDSGLSDDDNTALMGKLFPMLTQADFIPITNYTGFTVSADEDYHVTDSPNYIILPDLTGQADRNIVLPDRPKYNQPLAINNSNGSVFDWVLTNGIVKDKEGNALTVLANEKCYFLIFDGEVWVSQLPLA